MIDFYTENETNGTQIMSKKISKKFGIIKKRL